jgi:quinol monooxygenase YgiN
MTTGLLYKMTAKPGLGKELAHLLLESAKLFDGNPDCVGYLVSEANDVPDVVWVLELWTTPQAHEDAIKAPDVQALVGQAFGCMVGMPEQVELTPVGAKALLG